MRILLMSCGGTIVSPGEGRTSDKAIEKAADTLKDAVMMEGFESELRRRAQYLSSHVRKQISGLIEIEGLDLLDKDSTEVGPTDWSLMINTILDNYEKFDGFIITHGTNSLAYTSSALSFGLPTLGKPIVLTGANTPIGVPYSDALFNTANAVLLMQKLVAEERAGVACVFASKIMPGVRTKKSNGTELEAFRTFNAPDLGQVRPKEIILRNEEYEKYRRQNGQSPWKNIPPAKTAHDLAKHSHLDFSAVISSHTFHPGDDPRTYNAVLDDFRRLAAEPGAVKARGAMIIRAVGDGDTSKILHERVFKRAHAEKVPIVVTTQEPQGTSSFKGNQQSADVEKFRLIPAWDMSIETMVVKLRYLLSSGKSYEEINEEFTKSYFGEISVKKDG